jgi:hypothetical protein
MRQGEKGSETIAAQLKYLPEFEEKRSDSGAVCRMDGSSAFRSGVKKLRSE